MVKMVVETNYIKEKILKAALAVNLRTFQSSSSITPQEEHKCMIKRWIHEFEMLILFSLPFKKINA